MVSSLNMVDYPISFLLLSRARVYGVEPESMLWSQSLCCGARVYGVAHMILVSAVSLGLIPIFFGRQVGGTILYIYSSLRTRMNLDTIDFLALDTTRESLDTLLIDR